MKRFAAAFIAFVFTGCFLAEKSMNVTLNLPETPALWAESFPALGYEVRFIGIGGSEETVFVPPGKREIRVSCRTGYNAPFLAFPEYLGKTVDLVPAGGLFPHSLDNDGCLVLQWDAGFAASVLFSLARNGCIIETLNGERLLSEIGSRANGNPWNLDGELLTEHLANMKMRADYLKPLPRFQVSVTADCGSWVPANCFMEPKTTETDGLIVFEKLATGRHTFFLKGGRKRLSIDVSRTGEVHFSLRDW